MAKKPFKHGPVSFPNDPIPRKSKKRYDKQTSVSGMNYDLTKILKKEHEGKWVALSSDRTKVIDYSEDVVSLEKRVGRNGVVYMKALKSGISYAF